MSSHRQTAPARDRRARLGLVSLEDRAVPAAYTCVVDPATNPVGAVLELTQYINQSNTSSDEPDAISLFPGGVYVFDRVFAGNTALPVITPTASKASTETFFQLIGNGATFRRSDSAPDMRFLQIAGTGTNYGRAVISDVRFENGLLGATAGGGTGGSGGAVSVATCPVTFSGCEFVGNKVTVSGTQTGFGGAISFTTVSPPTNGWENKFTRCLFENNLAAEQGGAVNISGESAGSEGVANVIIYSFTESQFTANKARAGGGLYSRTDSFNLTGCSFVDNVAENNGGGVAVVGGEPAGDQVLVNIFTTTFNGNQAGGNGGGLFVNHLANDGTTLDVIAKVKSSTFSQNLAKGGGGGIYQVGDTKVSLDYNIIANNSDTATGTPGAASELSGVFSSTSGFNMLVIPPAPGTFTATSVSNSTIFADPLLGPLQNNGGFTLSRILQPGSPAINATGLSQAPAGIPTDQRGSGYDRIARAEDFFAFNMDIGATEVQNFGSDALIAESGGRQVTGTGSAFPTPLTVTVRDIYGRLVTDRQVILTFPTTTSGPGASYPLGNKLVVNPAAPATAGTGQGTIYVFGNQATGPYTLNATNGRNQFVGFALYNRPQLGTVLADQPSVVLGADNQTVVGGDATAVVGTAYKPLTVTVTDNFGNPVPQATVFFTVRLPSGGQGTDDPNAVPAASASGTFAGGDANVRTQLVQVQTDDQGRASATFTAGTKAGTVTILISAVGTDGDGSPVVLAADTVVLTNLPGAAARVVGAGQIDSGGVDTSGSGQQVRILQSATLPLVAVVTDQFGNPRPGVEVTFTNLDPARASGLGNTGGKASSDNQGRATFPAAANSKVDGSPYVVRATTPGGLTADFLLTNAPGLPAGVSVVSGDGQSAAVSDPRTAVGSSNAFSAPLVVRVLDAGGNVVPNALVTFSGAGARFSSTRVPTDGNGLATVQVATTDRAGTLTVSAAADTGSPATFSLSAVPGAPAAVTVISGGSQSVQAGSQYAPVVVRVVDQYQNPVPGAVPAVSAGGLSVSAPATDGEGLTRLAITAGLAAGTYPVTVQVGTQSASFTLSATGVPIDLDNVPPVVGQSELTAVGLDAGLASRVSVYNRDGSLRTQFAPYDPGFLGGSRVATARGPLGQRVVVVPGPGRFPDAQVFSADDGSQLAAFQPFEQTFVGGLYVSTGDIDRDGFEDYVFSADVGGGPRVKVVSGRSGATLQDFFGIEDVNFRGGARTAVADVNGDRVPDLIVAAGVGGGPRIAVYDGTSVTGFRAVPRRLVADFFAFEQGLRNGAYVAAGDVTGDGAADLVLGGGPGGGPRVRVLNGADLAAGKQSVVSDFFAGPTTDRGGVKVTVKEIDETASVTGGKADIVTASGAGDGSRVTVYLGSQLRAGSPPAARGFDDLTGFRGGVFVG